MNKKPPLTEGRKGEGRSPLGTLSNVYKWRIFLCPIPLGDFAFYGQAHPSIWNSTDNVKLYTSHRCLKPQAKYVTVGGTQVR